MPKFYVLCTVTYSGELTIEAEDAKAACKIAENLEVSTDFFFPPDTVDTRRLGRYRGYLG